MDCIANTHLSDEKQVFGGPGPLWESVRILIKSLRNSHGIIMDSIASTHFYNEKQNEDRINSNADCYLFPPLHGSPPGSDTKNRVKP